MTSAQTTRPANRKAYLACLIAALAFTLLEELKIRPFLFKQHVTTLAGSLPNALAPLILAFGYMAIKGAERPARTIAALVLGLVLYECVQPLMPGRTFDVNDIAASVLGGAVASLVVALVERSGRARHPPRSS